MLLKSSLRLAQAPRLALVGAGGKTTALFQLGREFITSNDTPTVLLTCTTHLARAQLALADHCYAIISAADLLPFEENLPAGTVIFTGAPAPNDRVAGLDEGALARLLDLADRQGLPLFIEADGSRQKPLKAPAQHEPVIPDRVDTVVVTAGLSGLGQPLTEDWVHRPDRFTQLTGLAAGEMITTQALASLLTNPLGGLKNIPAHARRVALLSQANTADIQAQGYALAQKLLGAYQAILLAETIQQDFSLPDGQTSAWKMDVIAAYEPVAGIILAAGGASRFGSPKALLEWRGEPLVRRAANTALQAGLDPVVVVTGAYAGQVMIALDGLPIQIVHNPDWRMGQSTSLIAGVEKLSASAGAAIFLLVDQPLVPPSMLRNLVELHAHSLPPLVAPLVAGQRGNPVLFDRQTFPDLIKLNGDVGGRALFARYLVTWLPWHDASVLLDIDQPEDYRKLLEMEI